MCWWNPDTPREDAAMLSRIVAAVMFLVLLLSWPMLLPAQTPNATVTGFVADQSKGVIVGANVDVINVDTNIHHPSPTNKDGSYTSTNLPPGNYKIEVEKSGFKSIV